MATEGGRTEASNAPEAFAWERAKWSSFQEQVHQVGWEPVLYLEELVQVAVVAVELGHLEVVAVVSALELCEVRVNVEDVVKLACFCVWISLVFSGALAIP